MHSVWNTICHSFAANSSLANPCALVVTNDKDRMVQISQETPV